MLVVTAGKEGAVTGGKAFMGVSLRLFLEMQNEAVDNFRWLAKGNKMQHPQRRIESLLSPFLPLAPFSVAQPVDETS